MKLDMEKKIVGIFVCMLLIVAAVLPVAGTMNKNEAESSSGQLSQLDVVVDKDEETSCKLADISATHNLRVPQLKYDDFLAVGF